MLGLAGVPRQLLRAELLWEGAGGWYAGPTAEWSPNRFPVDLANTLYADPYAIWGFKAGWRPQRGRDAGLSVFVEARNLTDKNYSPTTGVVQNATVPAQSAVFMPGDGRAFYAGVEFKW